MTTEGKAGFKEWAVYVPVSFLEATMKERPSTQIMLFMILDGHARDKEYCWLSNKKLAAIADKHARNIRKHLADLESGDDPWIARVPGVKKGRAGFVLYRRCHPSTPAWGRDRPLDEAAAVINGEKSARRGGRKRPGEGGENARQERAKTPALQGGENAPQNKTQGFNKTKVKATDALNGESVRPSPPPGRYELTKERLVEVAHKHCGKEVGEQVERRVDEIWEELGPDVRFFKEALMDAGDRNRPGSQNRVGSVVKWSMATAKLMAEDHRRKAARPAPGGPPPPSNILVATGPPKQMRRREPPELPIHVAPPDSDCRLAYERNARQQEEKVVGTDDGTH